MNSSIDYVRPAEPSPSRSSTLAGRLQAGVALNLLGTTFNQGSTLLVNIVVANLLGHEMFGHYTIILATVATIASLGQLSMGYTATKHVAEFRSVEHDRTSRILSLCGIVSCFAAMLAALGLASVADWLAAGVLGARELTPQLRMAAVAVFFTVLNGFLTGALAGLESYSAIARSGVASGTLYAAVCTALAWRFGLSGAVAGLAISAFLQSVVLSVAIRHEAARAGVRFTSHGLWRERAIVSRFALPASLTGLITLPAVWTGSALLARQPGGFEQLALFGAANSFRVMVLFVPNALNNVSMSLLNNQWRSSPGGFRRLFWMNALSTVFLAVGAAALIMIASPWLLRLFGPAFIEGRPVLAILLAAAAIEAIAIAAYQIVVSHGRLWASLWGISVPRDGSLVLLAAVLTPTLGAAGLATAHAVGWTLALLGTGLIVQRLGFNRVEPAVDRDPLRNRARTIQ